MSHQDQFMRTHFSMTRLICLMYCHNLSNRKFLPTEERKRYTFLDILLFLHRKATCWYSIETSFIMSTQNCNLNTEETKPLIIRNYALYLLFCLESDLCSVAKGDNLTDIPKHIPYC